MLPFGQGLRATKRSIGFFFVSAANGKQVHTSAVKLAEKGQIAVVDGGLLPTPQKEVGKIIFAAPFAAVVQIAVVLGLVDRIQMMKSNHVVTSLWVVWPV